MAIISHSPTKMDLNFDDPNLLVDDSTSALTKLPDWIADLQDTRIKALEVGSNLQENLKLHQLDTAKFAAPSIQFDDKGITINIYKDCDCPTYAVDAWESMIEMISKPIRYRQDGDSDYLWCDEGDVEREHHDGLEDTKKYVAAAKYLPKLLLNSRNISLETLEHKEIFNLFEKSYREQILLIEYYLLHNLQALTELKFKVPRKRQYKPGKISAKRFEFVQDLWMEALEELKASSRHSPLCLWLLIYDSPAQIWFAQEAMLIKEIWQEKIFPERTKSKRKFYESEKAFLLRMEDFKGVTITLANESGEANQNILSFYQAFELVTIQMIQERFCSSGYTAYLAARHEQATNLRYPSKYKQPQKGFG